MRIGLTYDLKSDHPDDPNLSDDAFEEFDSPVTIEALAAVCRSLGHEPVFLGDGRGFVEKVLASPPEFVFNIAEGVGVGRAREARVPAVLEMLGIPYSGSDPLTLALTLDKPLTKTVVAAAGLHVPWSETIPSPPREQGPNPAPCSRGGLVSEDAPFPLIVKPAWEGSSKGIRNKCLVHNRVELADVVASLQRDHQQPLMAEQFIGGLELTVGILGNTPPAILGVMSIAPVQPTAEFVYSLEVKRDFRRQVHYECPPALPAGVLAEVQRAALLAYEVLGCRDVARMDFRLDEKGTPYFLELNPLPGLNPESSDLVIMAELLGWTHQRLVETILTAALRRVGLARDERPPGEQGV